MMAGMNLMLKWFADSSITYRRLYKFKVYFGRSCLKLTAMTQRILSIATSYKEHHFKTKNDSVQLTGVGCSSSEHNLTSCCTSEVSSSLYCHSGAYAGVRCKHY